ncbi:hypothetical protein GOBAR_DD36315 [Gossypium barbadense]|nr:hypothetical protein GOBAR_DD36315 [Gossypium barbadense]
MGIGIGANYNRFYLKVSCRKLYAYCHLRLRGEDKITWSWNISGAFSTSTTYMAISGDLWEVIVWSLWKNKNEFIFQGAYSSSADIVIASSPRQNHSELSKGSTLDYGTQT